MGRCALLAISLGLLLSLGIAASVIAHGGSEEILVEPGAVAAGDTVIVAGTGLEPESDRVLLLAGEDLIVEFGTVTADAEGMFQIELTIPRHLPSGTYEFRAIGDETLTAELVVTAATGGAEASPGPDDASQTIVPRERTPIELAVILAVGALAAVAGGLLVWHAERLRGGGDA